VINSARATNNVRNMFHQSSGKVSAMKCQSRKSRFGLLSGWGRCASCQRSTTRRRSLRVESLENRAMLTTLFVTDAGDSGDGTFRAAVEAANFDPSIDRIVFHKVDTVGLGSAVEFTGGQSMTIDGKGATIEAASAGANDLLISSGGADLDLSRLTFQNGDNGILVPVPGGATGTVAVSLNDVTIRDNARYGLFLDDQAEDTDASVRLDISNSTITGNGTGEGVSDFDGIRVNDGGEGSIIANVANSRFDGNGGDGLELDEKGDGGVRACLLRSTFNDNGFQNPDDKEDGIDFDEAGEGDLWISAVDVAFSGNSDEGADLDEEDGGDVDISFVSVQASNNEDEGIKVDEKEGDDSADGDLTVSLVNVKANGSEGEEGIALTEEGNGNFTAVLRNVVASGNDKEGIDLAEGGSGNLAVRLQNVVASDNDDDGIQVGEEDDGDLSAIVVNVTANRNSKVGLKIEQEDDGDGSLRLNNANLEDNEDGPLETDGVVMT
jgi:hypothetical protein